MIVPDSMTLVVEYQFRVYKIEMISCLKVRVTLTGTWTLHWTGTSHSAYVATETELDESKIDGLLPPNIL